MSDKLKAVLCAFVILFMIFVLWLLIQQDLNIEKELSPAAENELDLMEKEKPKTPITFPLVDGNATIAPLSEEKDPFRDVLKPEGIYFSGSVRNGVTLEPIKAYDFELFREYNKKKEVIIHETVNDDEGRFLFQLEKGGSYNLMIRSSRLCSKKLRGLEISEKTGLKGLLIDLDPGSSLSGRVVDHVTGRPIQEALVGPADYATQTSIIRLYKGFNEYCVFSKTDVHGCFTLNGLSLEGLGSWPREGGKVRIAAVHPNYAEGFAEAVPGEGKEIEIHLKTGYCIFGKAFNDKNLPVSGLMISITGENNPMARPVLTGPDGSYRTPPTLPGRVFLRAGPPPGETEASFAFTKEMKLVELIDHDVEVNFGPSQDSVTWQGVFYDSEGLPVAGGSIAVSPADCNVQDSYRLNLRILAECDDNGCFQFNKLALGKYKVDLFSATRSTYISWKNVTFDVPGIVKKDIQLSGTRIDGQVVDALSGTPLNGESGYVQALMNSSDSKSYYSDIDEEGRFLLKGIIPGSYDLTASVKGFPSKHIRGFKIEEGQATCNLLIKIPTGGKLHIKIMGFEEEDQKDFCLYMQRVKEGMSLFSAGNYESCRLDKSGNYEKKYILEAGNWSISVVFKDLGTVERSFEIFPEEITEVLIQRDDWFRTYEDIDVSGSLSYSDGSPCAKAHFSFFGIDIPGLEKDKRDVQGTTDTEGRFLIKGFRPGRWLVRATLADGGELTFSDLLIPEKPQNPFPLYLTIPCGRLQAILCDDSTGILFSDKGPEWWTFLRDVKTGKRVGELQGGHTGSRITMVGIPEGNLQLTVKAKGYEDYVSNSFFLTEGQVMDLKEIRLNPSGILDLEVVSKNGQPVKSFSVFCDGNELYDHDRDLLETGRYRYYGLPLGSVSIKVSAHGFQENYATIKLEPRQPGELRLVLCFENE